MSKDEPDTREMLKRAESIVRLALALDGVTKIPREEFVVAFFDMLDFARIQLDLAPLRGGDGAPKEDFDACVEWFTETARRLEIMGGVMRGNAAIGLHDGQLAYRLRVPKKDPKEEPGGEPAGTGSAEEAGRSGPPD